MRYIESSQLHKTPAYTSKYGNCLELILCVFDCATIVLCDNRLMGKTKNMNALISKHFCLVKNVFFFRNMRRSVGSDSRILCSLFRKITMKICWSLFSYSKHFGIEHEEIKHNKLYPLCMHMDKSLYR